MRVWKFLWGQKGRKPTVNQLDHETIAKDKETGSLYILTESSGGARDVIQINGSAPGASDAHLRAHQIDSVDDHPAVAEEDRGKLVATNPDTGEIELIPKPADPENFWTRDDTFLSPATPGDKIVVYTSGVSSIAIEAAGDYSGIYSEGGYYGIIGSGETGVFGNGDTGVHGDGFYVGVKGTSTDHTGVHGISAESVGVLGDSTNNYGVFGGSVNSTGIYGLTFYGQYGVLGEGPNIGVGGISPSGAAVYGESQTGNPFVGVVTPAAGGSIGVAQYLECSPAASAIAGIGVATQHAVKNASGLARVASAVRTVLTTITNAAESATKVWSLIEKGVMTDVMSLTSTGILDVKKRATIRGSYPMSYTIFKQTADKSITNTTTETTLFGSGVGDLVVPANYVESGDYIRISLQGIISTPTTPAQILTLRVKYGSNTLITLSGYLVAGMESAVFDLELNMAIRTIGATGSIRAAGNVLIEIRVHGYPNIIRLQTTSDVTIDTTVDNKVNITAQWTNALADNSLITHVSTVEIL